MTVKLFDINGIEVGQEISEPAGKVTHQWTIHSTATTCKGFIQAGDDVGHPVNPEQRREQRDRGAEESDGVAVAKALHPPSPSSADAGA